MNALLGKKPHRYNFEIIPTYVGGLKKGHELVSVVCESGSKISYTEPSSVQDGSAAFNNIMRMTSTIYKQGNSLLPKEYTFKVQSIRQSSSRVFSESRRKTIARAKLNLAEYCSHSSTPAAADVELQLQPQGTLKLSIRAVWLQHVQQQRSGKGSGGGSEQESTDISSLQSSVSSGSIDSDAAGGGNVARTTSADLDMLVDYHHQTSSSRSGVRQTPALSTALTARYNAPSGSSTGPVSSLPPAQDDVQADSASVPAQQHTAPAAVQGSSRHRRSNSSPASTLELRAITPIIEADREGLDPAGSLERTLSNEVREAQAGQSAAGFLGVNAARPQQQVLLDASLAAAATEEAAEDGEPGGLRTLSSHLPSWMWPFSRDVVRGVTTETIMRQISSSSNAADVPKLQQLARGLLCERNDWRFKATQWERNAGGLQQQVDQLQQAKQGLQQQLQLLESQLSQLQQDALVDKLVEAKLQLAQADLQATSLKGQLTKEKERSRQLAAKLTSVQSKYEGLLDQQAAAADKAALPAGTAASTASSSSAQQQQQGPGQGSGDQGEGLALQSPTGAVPAGRRLSDSGWGFAGLAGGFMRATSSYMVGVRSSSSTSQGTGQQGRRLSEPGCGEGDVAAGVQGRPVREPRHSMS